MLIGLGIRDVVLIETLDLSIGPGLTALTGETGAGKSIILDALGLATGARAEAGLVRRGRSQAVATAVFAPPGEHAAWAYLDDKGVAYERDEDLVLRRQLSADGRSRAFVNDQAVSVAVLRELGELLVEVHGQHETVGLLDSRNHRPLLDQYGACAAALDGVAAAWSAWREARDAAETLRREAAQALAEREELALRLGELDRLDPKPGEEERLAGERALLGAAEKTLADIAAARDSLGDNLGSRLAQAFRALERARERAVAAGAGAEAAPVRLIAAAADAVDRALVEAQEAAAAIDAAAGAFDFEPDRLEKAEERLFALRGLARKLNVAVEALPAERERMARALGGIEDAAHRQKEADARAAAARASYFEAARSLSQARQAAAERLAQAVNAELPPLKLDKAKLRVAVEPLAEERAGPAGLDRVEFEVATNPGAPFGPLGAIASGGELARFALALKAALAARGAGPQPLMIFDEVDQGVGGAVADAVGLRLKRLGAQGQVLVVTHSPQVAARAEAHWRVSKAGGVSEDLGTLRTAVEVLESRAREEEIARMLAGAEITEAARAAARALIS
jgi:DNA repair protein RecN (Recombination protein N)